MYCSHACFVQGESTIRPVWKPSRSWLRPVGWILAGALVAGLIALGVVVATRPSKAKPLAVHKVSHVRHALGSRGRPIPVGRTASIGTRWRMEVVSTRPNVSQAALGLGHQRLPRGHENYLVRLKLHYSGPKPDNVLSAIDAIDAKGAHNPYYSPDDQCNPPRKLDFPGGSAAKIRSGKPTTGSLCFLIAKRDAATLKLFVSPPDAPTFRTPTRRTWFALRPPVAQGFRPPSSKR